MGKNTNLDNVLSENDPLVIFGPRIEGAWLLHASEMNRGSVKLIIGEGELILLPNEELVFENLKIESVSAFSDNPKDKIGAIMLNHTIGEME